MTVKEFKSDPDRVKYIRTLLEDPIFKLWIEAIDESLNPVNQFLDTKSISPHGAHIELGVQNGFSVFRHVLLSGGQYPTEPAAEEDRGEQSYAVDPDKQQPNPTT